jgi:DNA-binding MarR family transcriptional regulator
VETVSSDAAAGSTETARADQRLGMILKRAEQAMVRAKSAALKPVGLTLAQYVALVELDLQPGVAAATLARTCLVTPQAIMVVLRQMEEQGLVSRSPHPRHPTVLELRMTDVGREALHAGRQRIDPLERRVLNAFAVREVDSLSGLLRRFIDAFEAASP